MCIRDRSYEELLSLRLKEVEQMTDLVISIQDRTAGEALMNELCLLYTSRCV